MHACFVLTYDILLLTKREVFGVGLRFSLLNHDSLKFDLGTGLMKKIELLDKTALLSDDELITSLIIRYDSQPPGSLKRLRK